MIVQLLAHTVLVEKTARDMGYEFHPYLDDGDGGRMSDVTDGDELHEIAGRECYQSWGRRNPDTATNSTYLGHIQVVGHVSVFEHACFTFSIREVSRSLTHELVRHRHLSPSQVSQRYVDESQGGFVVPPEIRRLAWETGSPEIPLILRDAHQSTLDLYQSLVSLLTDRGINRKRARQAARSILPNGHHTRLVLTGNVRAWREMVDKRASYDATTGEPHADLEFFELARRILEILREYVPNSVQDLWQSLYLDWEKTPYAIAQARRTGAGTSDD